MVKRRSYVKDQITSKGKRNRLNRIGESHNQIDEPLETSSTERTFMTTMNDYQIDEIQETTTKAPNMNIEGMHTDELKKVKP